MKSRIRLVIKGLNQERAFNDLAKEIKILKLDRQDKQTCQIDISPKDLNKTKNILKDNNFEILSVTSFGPRKFWQKFLSCYGVIAGILLCLTLFLIQKGFVWRVAVYGNEKLSSAEITSFVEDELKSRWIGKIDTKQIEIQLKEKFDRISSVSVAIVGQSLLINLSESILPEEMGKFKPIICEVDCKITAINLIQGTLAVKIGEIVRAGDILVEPYILDADGGRRDVKPMAKISADVWFTGTSEHCDSYIKTVRTGRKVEQSQILLFGLIIYSHQKDIPFKHFETERSVEYLNKNLLIPLKIEKIKYFETKTELVETSFDEIRNEIVESARQKALQNVKDYEIIKEESYSTVENAGVHIVTYIITVNREVGING